MGDSILKWLLSLPISMAAVSRYYIGNQVVGAIVLSPTNAVIQEAVAGSVHRVVVARGRASRDAAVPYIIFSSTSALSIRFLGSSEVHRL